MKKTKILLALTIAAMTFFGACKKSDNIQQEQKPDQSTSKLFTVTSSDLNAIFAQSRSVHNGLLAQEFEAIKNDQVATIQDLKVFETHYFQSVPYSSAAIDGMNSNFFAIYGTPNFDQTLDSKINSDAYVSDLMAWITYTVGSSSGLMPVQQFQQLINSKLTDVANNPSMPDNDKQICAAVLGVASGSYDYWSNNIDNWNVMMTAKGKTAAQSTSSKAKDFFIDDCRGGSWGGLIGSLVPGIGNVAGCIMGGAILSAATALSWD